MDLSLKRLRESCLPEIIVLAALSFAITLPILLWGVPSGNDLPQHFQFAQQMDAAVRHGSAIPSWGLGSNEGLGDVGIRFYPPASYYPLLIFKAITQSWFYGSFAVIAFWFFLGGAGCYFLGRDWFDRRSALAAGMIFMILPYHTNQIFNAFLYAEFAAASILPFCLLFAGRICKRSNTSDLAGFAASTALLILTHLPTAIMGAVATTIYVVFLCEPQRRIASALRLVVAGAVGLAASSFYWIKVVMELGFVKHSVKEFSSSAFDFHRNFLGAFFYVSADEYSSRSLFFGDVMLLLTMGLAVSAIIVIVTSRNKLGPNGKALIAVFATGVFLATPLSLPIWSTVNLLQKIQFPFRWMTIISLATAILAGASFAALTNAARTSSRPLVLIAGGLCLFCIVFSVAQVIRPAIYIPKADFEARVASLRAARSCECWLPVWARTVEPIDPQIADGNTIPVRVNGTITNEAIQIAPNGQAIANIFYYPFWHLFSGNNSFDVIRDDVGRVSFPATELDANAELRFTEPTYVSWAIAGSILGWLAIFGTLFFDRSLQKRDGIIPAALSV